MFETYDRRKSYEFNYERGPVFQSAAKAMPETALKKFLGLEVRSRLGIAAGLLLNSKWIKAYAQRGFDILTYKTVRSSKRACYPPPNWVFVEDDGSAEGPVYVMETPSDDPKKISSSVCFGMPSMAPEVWREDIGLAKAALAKGQILIVSVVATPREGASREELADDFCKCAKWAAEAGADVVEANFSCPNVCSQEGTIFMDAPLSGYIAKRLRETLGTKPLLAKLGHIERQEQMSELFGAIGGFVNGVTMVNAITRPVLQRDGQPAFGKQFVKAGVLGRAIHKPSVEDVRRARDVINKQQLNLSIAAVGGVSSAEDIKDFFAAGADAVLLGSSPMYLPDLAVEVKKRHAAW
jgi:dihydroorotate dehydrogenase